MWNRMLYLEKVDIIYWKNLKFNFLQKILVILHQQNKEIGLAGKKLMFLMYYGKSTGTLTKLRYAKWNQAVAPTNQINPE